MTASSAARGVGGLAALAFVGSTVFLVPSADAAAPTVFGASATASGIEFSFTNASLPLVQTFQLTTPATSSTISSLGNSISFASAPYPGDVVQNLPSVASALVPVPIPAYPFYVAAGTGEDPKEVSYPGLNLRVEAGATVVQSRAAVGADGAGGLSTSRTEVLGDGSVRAVGSAVYKILDLGPQVRFRGVDALAQVTSTGGELTRTSSLAIGRIQIPGLAVTIPESTPGTDSLPQPIPGLPQAPPVELPPIPFAAVGGRTIEQPDIGFENGRFTIQLPFLGGNRYELPASVLADALKSAGISMSYQQAHETKTGVIAPALIVSYDVAAPPDNPLYNGPGTARYKVGEAAASVNVQAEESAGGGSTTGTVSGLPGDAGVGNGALPSTAGVDSAFGTALGTLPGIGAGLGGQLPAVAGAPAASAGPVDGVLARAAGVTYNAPFTKDLSAIYLIVVALAGLGVLLSVLRQLGVRAR